MLISAVLVVCSLAYALDARARLATVMNMNQAQSQRADLLSQLRQAHAKWQQHAAERQQMNHDIESTSVLTGNWRSRSLLIEQASMTRDQVQAYLASLQHAEGYLFIPRRFELKVLQEGDDLMSWTQGSTNQLELSLSGDYLIRSEP
ncbi:hypothetical protein QGM61_01880 [Pseudohongiella sp. SYSU M77423]|nr:hypothetical protein [Pseudohongiella sp. SYSU M77423]